MNVSDMMKNIYGNETFTAAYMMDQEALKKIEASYQEAWDCGAGFTPATMFGGRKEDSEAEQKACAGQMLNSIRDLIQRAWLSQYSRDEMVSLCNLMIRGPERCYTRVRLCASVELNIYDLASGWSKIHPEERPIYSPDPDIG